MKLSQGNCHKHLWPGGIFVDFDNNLNTVIKLREALGDSAETPVFIETVPRRGYRFIAPISMNEPERTVQSRQFSLPENHGF